MIGIFSFLSLRYAQFVYKYTNILDEKKIPYELIIWNRDEVEKPNRENWIFYEYPMNSFQPFYKKTKGFISFSLFMRKTIKEKKYDKLIVLTTQTAMPLFDILLSKYKNKYIYDYRDVTFENLPFYSRMVNKIVENSYFTAISSKGFLDNLKKSDKYIVSHNTRDFQPKKVTTKKGNKIRIVYWGMVRQLEFNKHICDLFGNDSRFELYYHGAGYHNELKDYSRIKGYKNITITGEYSLSDISGFVSNTDIVLNCYENDKKQKLAITVKYYDAISFYRPMLVMKDSYMAELVNEKKLGFVVAMDNKQNLDELYSNISSFDYNLFRENCDKEIDAIRKDDKFFENKLIEFSNFNNIL